MANPPNAATQVIQDRLAEELTPPLLAVGLDVEAIEITPAGKRRLLRVAVDKDGGVLMDDIAAATREVSRVLDESDVMGEQPYTLEVTSPGVDRPLSLPRHWRRNIGRLVKTTIDGGDTVTGRVLASDETTVTLDVEGTERELPLTSLSKTKVQIEFNRKET